MTENLVTFKEACAAVRGTKLFVLDTSGHNQRGYSYALVPLMTKTVEPEMTFCGYDEITEEPICVLCPPKPFTHTFPDREVVLLETISQWGATRTNKTGKQGAMIVGFDRDAFYAAVESAKHGTP